VLAGALERTPEERRVYLDQVCSEPALRSEVESLIAAHEQGDNTFMGGPVVSRDEALKSGTKLGPYEILARLAVTRSTPLGTFLSSLRPSLLHHVRQTLSTCRGEDGGASFWCEWLDAEQHSFLRRLLMTGLPVLLSLG
jgi:hypothetical protein